jgi:hypothetical protein
VVYVVSQGNGLEHLWDVLPACVCMTITNHSWYVCRPSHLSTVRSVYHRQDAHTTITYSYSSVRALKLGRLGTMDALPGLLK